MYIQTTSLLSNTTNIWKHPVSIEQRMKNATRMAENLLPLVERKCIAQSTLDLIKRGDMMCEYVWWKNKRESLWSKELEDLDNGFKTSWAMDRGRHNLSLSYSERHQWSMIDDLWRNSSAYIRYICWNVSTIPYISVSQTVFSGTMEFCVVFSQYSRRVARRSCPISY